MLRLVEQIIHQKVLELAHRIKADSNKMAGLQLLGFSTGDRWDLQHFSLFWGDCGIWNV